MEIKLELDIEPTTAPIEPTTAPIEPTMAPIEPTTAVSPSCHRRRAVFPAIIKPSTPSIVPRALIEPRSPIKLKTAPRATIDCLAANDPHANDLHAIQLPRVVMTTGPKPSCETITSRRSRLPSSNSALDLCSPASPRVSPLITSQFSSPNQPFSTNSSALPPSGLLLPSSPMLPSSSMLPPSSMLPNQPLPIHWPNGFPSSGFPFLFLLLPIHWPTQDPSGVFLLLFTSSPLPPQTPTLWPTQVPSWVSFFFYCIIGLTSMLLPQGCEDPLVSGDGQTVSYQPQIHANTIRSSQEQHRCSHNL